MNMGKSVQKEQEIYTVEKAKGKKFCTKGGPTPGDGDIVPDIVDDIKHNVETSLAAPITNSNSHESANSSGSSGNFFQHYFQVHTTTLPSRNVASARRLSQCREEDEEEDRMHPSSDLAAISGSDKSLSESSSGSKTSVIDTVTGPTHKFVITKTKHVQVDDAKPPAPPAKTSTAAQIFANMKKYVQSNTVHFPTSDPNRPSLYSVFNRTPHYDSRFFDSSLIEMKSHASSDCALDVGAAAEDIWVKRPVSETKEVSRIFAVFSQSGCCVSTTGKYSRWNLLGEDCLDDSRKSWGTVTIFELNPLLPSFLGNRFTGFHDFPLHRVSPLASDQRISVTPDHLSGVVETDDRFN